MYSIGEGIIGSAYEEASRKQLLHWIEGTSYLLPKCTGIACGWVAVVVVAVDVKANQEGNADSCCNYNVDNDDNDDDDEYDNSNTLFIKGETIKEDNSSNNNNNNVTTTATAATADVITADTTSTTTTDIVVDDNVVVMYSLKVSSNDLQSMVHTVPVVGTSTWVMKARELFLGRLAVLTVEKAKKKNDGNTTRQYNDDDDIAEHPEEEEDCIALSENETATMRLIIELATPS